MLFTLLLSKHAWFKKKEEEPSYGYYFRTFSRAYCHATIIVCGNIDRPILLVMVADYKQSKILSKQNWIEIKATPKRKVIDSHSCVG